jgi:hypothetical protein
LTSFLRIVLPHLYGKFRVFVHSSSTAREPSAEAHQER